MGRYLKVAVVALIVICVGVGTAFAVVKPTATTKPGKGCGDKNHVHYRQTDCKK